MVSTLSGALANIVQATSFGLNNLVDLAKAASMKARHLISTISHAEGAPSKQSTHSSVDMWRTFPLPFNWQSSFHEKVSLRTFNLSLPAAFRHSLDENPVSSIWTNFVAAMETCLG